MLPSASEWVIYVTAVPKRQVHKVCVSELRRDAEWNPGADNPKFLGVWRFDLLDEE